MKTLIVLLAFACVFRIGDAAITEWTEPVISGADGSAAAATTIDENIAVGSTGVTIQAVGSGAVTYIIESQPTTGKLTIDSGTGVLSLESGHSFDFETEPTYVLVIVGTDPDDSSTGTAIVTLSINNVNEDPVFAAAQYVATVADASTADTAVITVTATDVDAGDTITYTISGSDFKIDSSTGAISVNTGITLDAETLGGYSLDVTATDTSSAFDTATVWIAVKDCSSGSGALLASLLTVFVAMAVLFV